MIKTLTADHMVLGLNAAKDGVQFIISLHKAFHNQPGPSCSKHR